MDEPTVETLLRVTRVAAWEKAKANLMILVATHPSGSSKESELLEVITQFTDYIEGGELNK